MKIVITKLKEASAQQRDDRYDENAQERRRGKHGTHRGHGGDAKRCAKFRQRVFYIWGWRWMMTDDFWYMGRHEWEKDEIKWNGNGIMVENKIDEIFFFFHLSLLSLWCTLVCVVVLWSCAPPFSTTTTSSSLIIPLQLVLEPQQDLVKHLLVRLLQMVLVW